jgi:hypothetical protein
MTRLWLLAALVFLFLLVATACAHQPGCGGG